MNDLMNTTAVPATIRTQVDYVLLDDSGSMQGKWWDSLDAIDAYVLGCKAQGVNSRVIISTLSDGRTEIQRDEQIGTYTTMRDAPIGGLFGGTPLYDAINSMCRELKALDPPKCSIVIITDGDENSSRITDLVTAKAMLEWCRAKGWQITFIGCDFNNRKMADLLGAGEASAIGVQTAFLSDATSELAKKRARYSQFGEEMGYTDDEKQQFGGYLNAPEGSNGK